MKKKVKVDTTYQPPVLPEDVDELREFALKTHAQLDEHTRQRDNLSKLTQELSEDLDCVEWQQEQEARAVRIRMRWQNSMDTAYKSVQLVLGSLPVPIDAQVFEPDDWTRLDQLIDAYEHAIATCKQWRHRTAQRVIEA